MYAKETIIECYKNKQQQQPEYPIQLPLPVYPSRVPTTSVHPTVIAPPQSTTTIITPNQPTVIYNYEPRTVHVRGTKVIGNIQVIVGAFSVIFGLSFVLLGAWGDDSLAGNGPFGIAGIPPGLFILANGIIGKFSSRNPNNGCLNGTNLGFSIISCLLSFGNISAFSIAIIALQKCPEFDYNHRWGHWNVCTEKSSGLALATVLLLGYFIELFVALTSSIFSCWFYSCCKECCRGSTQGAVLNYPQSDHCPSNYHYNYEQHPPPTVGYPHTHHQIQTNTQYPNYGAPIAPPHPHAFAHGKNETETMADCDPQPYYNDEAKLI